MGLLDDAIKEHLDLKRRRGADAGEISRLESEALGPVRRSAEGVPDLSDTFEPPSDEPSDEPPARATETPPAASAPAAAPTSTYEPPDYEPPPPPPASAYEPPPAPPPLTPAPVSADPPPAHEPPDVYEPPPVHAPPARERWMTEDFPEREREPEPEAEAEDPAEPVSGGGLFSRLRGGRRSRHDRDPEPEPPAAREPEPDRYDPPPPPAAPHAGYTAIPPVHEPDIVPADDEPDVEDLLEETPEFLEETPEHDRLWFEQRPPRDFNFDD